MKTLNFAFEIYWPLEPKYLYSLAGNTKTCSNIIYNSSWCQSNSSTELEHQQKVKQKERNFSTKTRAKACWISFFFSFTFFPWFKFVRDNGIWFLVGTKTQKSNLSCTKPLHVLSILICKKQEWNSFSFRGYVKDDIIFSHEIAVQELDNTYCNL